MLCLDSGITGSGDMGPWEEYIKKRGVETFEMDVEEYGRNKTGWENSEGTSTKTSRRRSKNISDNKEEEVKLDRVLWKKNSIVKACSQRMVKRRRQREKRRIQLIDNSKVNNKYEITKRMAEEIEWIGIKVMKKSRLFVKNS